MPFQEGLQPGEDLVGGGLGVNGHNSIGRPYENGYSGEANLQDSPIVPIVSDITPSFLPSPQQSTNHPCRPSPTGSHLSVVINTSPARKKRSLSKSPAAEDRNKSPLETVLSTRSQPRTTNGSPAAEVAVVVNMNQDETPGAAQQPRKRGRPKGWKPGTPYNAQNGGGPSSANRPVRKPKSSSAGPSQEPRRRGRPPKPPDLTIREWFLQSEPKYLTFDCEWQEDNLQGKLTQCPAELQNMDTLRKHVFLIHSNTEPLVCRWGPCGNKLAQTMESEENAASGVKYQQQQPEQFEDEEAFRAHVEKEHLERYVWQMGDGPQNKGIWTIQRDPNKLPQYLFGQGGDQVTPSIKDQQFEDTQGMLIRKRRLREIQRQALENAPDESEFFLPPPESEM